MDGDDFDNELTERYIILYVHLPDARRMIAMRSMSLTEKKLCSTVLPLTSGGSTHTFIAAVRSRLLGGPFLTADRHPRTCKLSAADISAPEQRMRAWHRRDVGGLDARLNSLRLMPDFFAPPPAGARSRDIDAAAMIQCLRAITGTMDQQFAETAGGDDGEDAPMSDDDLAEAAAAAADRVWTVENGPAQLLFCAVRAHVRSYLERTPTPEEREPGSGSGHRFPTSWCGIFAAMQLYMYSVLGLQHAEQPALGRLLRRTLLMLEQDLATTETQSLRPRPRTVGRGSYGGGGARGGHGKAGKWKGKSVAFDDYDFDSDEDDHGADEANVLSDFWLWKAFMGAFALSRAEHDGDAVLDNNRSLFKPLRDTFDARVRQWAAAANVAKWADARRALMRIVWPVEFLEPGVAEGVWEAAIQG